MRFRRRNSSGSISSARDHVGVGFIGPHQLRDAEATQRAGRRLVGVERIGIDRHVVDLVGARRGEPRLLRHPRPDIGIGTAVPEHLAAARGEAAVGVDRALDAERRGVTGDGVEHLFKGQRDLHRPFRDHRQRGDQRFELDVELGAITAAEERHLDAHAALRPAEQAGDLDAHEGRALRGGVEREALVPEIGDGDERLERKMQHLLGAELMLEHLGGGGEGRVDVADAELIVERDVGALGALEMLEVGEGAGGLELLVHHDLVLRRLDFVEHRRQFVILGDDQGGLLRHMGIVRQHHRDGLADIMHLVDGEDRLVVEGRAVIGVRDDLAHVLRGDDAVDARHRLGGAGVDQSDPAVGDGRAEDPAEQHARQPQIMGVFRPSRDLLARFQPRQRAADLAAGNRRRGRCGRHQWLAPRPSSDPSTAWRTARRT
jgi:hypothetical protein